MHCPACPSLVASRCTALCKLRRWDEGKAVVEAFLLASVTSSSSLPTDLPPPPPHLPAPPTQPPPIPLDTSRLVWREKDKGGSAGGAASGAVTVTPLLLSLHITLITLTSLLTHSLTYPPTHPIITILHTPCNNVHSHILYYHSTPI